MPKSILTKENIAFIKKNRLKMSGSDIADKIGVSKSVVNRYMRYNGITAPKELIIKWRSAKMYKPFLPWEDEIIEELIYICSIKQIAVWLQRTQHYVGSRARELGYGWVIDIKAKASRIKKGTIPPNKGRKQAEYMTADAIARTAKTRFKKGQKIHNELYDNCIRIRHDHADRRGGRKYKWIRLSKAKWQQLHVYNWEKENGPVPKGHIVVFKTTDTMNCEVSNLELITRAEHAVRNSNHENPSDSRIAFYMATKSRKVDPELRDELLKHPELIEAKRQSLKLKRLIKNERRNNTEAGTTAQ